MAKTVEEVLFEIIGICETMGLDYVVLGGIAVRVHGIPRPTFDVDVVLSVDQAQLILFFEHCEKLEYHIAEPFRSGWRDEVGGMPIVKIKTYLPEGHSVDVDLFINETPFQQSIMERRQQFELSGHTIHIVTPEDLILLKLLANRPRDLGDIADIVFIQGELDRTYLDHWAAALEISDRLETNLEN